MVNRNELVSYLHLCPTDFFPLGVVRTPHASLPSTLFILMNVGTHEMAK